MRVSEDPVCIYLFRQNLVFYHLAFEISRLCRTASANDRDRGKAILVDHTLTLCVKVYGRGGGGRGREEPETELTQIWLTSNLFCIFFGGLECVRPLLCLCRPFLYFWEMSGFKTRELPCRSKQAHCQLIRPSLIATFDADILHLPSTFVRWDLHKNDALPLSPHNPKPSQYWAVPLPTYYFP